MPEAKAVRIVGAGGPEVLELGPVEVRDPGSGEVLVRVAAAGLNRADCLQRRGVYPAPPGVPKDVPGLEFAGEVEAVGEGVRDWVAGDLVMGIVGGGSMATRLVASADELLRVPQHLSLQEAAAVPEAFFTAYDAIVVQGELKANETVLLHAVASGVGTAAIQLVAAWGARSIGTSRTKEKLGRCGELGLEHGVWVKDGQFSERVLEAAPSGADVILDTIGASYLGQNMKTLAKKGRLIVIGLMGGVKGDLSLGQLVAKRATIRGSVLRSRSADEKAWLTARFAEDVLPRLSRGELRPIVDDVLPMSEIRQAHDRMDRNETFGKLVMYWD